MFWKKPVSKGDRIVRFTFGWFAIGALLVALLVIGWTWILGVDSLQRGIDALKPWLLAWRILLFGILIGGWPLWVSWLAWWADLDASRQQAILDQRWYVALWLVVIELVLGQGVTARFFGYLLN